MNEVIVTIKTNDKEFIKAISSLEKGTEKSAKNMQGQFSEVNKQVDKSINGFKALSEGVTTFSSSFKTALDITGIGLSATLVGLSKITTFSKTGFIGTIEALKGVSVGLFTLGLSLKDVDNSFANFVGTLSLVTSVLIFGLTSALTFLIIKVGELAFNIGTNLVSKFQQASSVFIEAEKDLFVFTQTIENYNRITNGVIGTTEAWTATVNELSKEFNFTRSELQKAATEIIGVGSKLGLTEKQLQSLLGVTAEYAKVSGKDVFDTSVRFVTALNGNAQAVTSLGIKLNEAANQTFLFKQGITDSFRTLSENEKVQVRYNNLLSQYSGIAGIAAGIAGGLSDAQNDLAVNIDRINTELGKGAAIIESNNVLTTALSRSLALVNDGLLQASGFIGALGARVLQISGLFLTWALKIAIVISGFRLLNIFLSRSLVQTAFATSIPVLNTSLNGVIATLTGTQIKINSVQNALIAFGRIIKVQFFQLGFILGTSKAQALTFGQAFTQVFLRISGALKVFRGALVTTLATLGPYAVVIGSVVASFLVLRKAFILIEERTRVFSTIFEGLTALFKEVSPLVDSLRVAFDAIVDSIALVTRKLVGLVVVGLSTVIKAIVDIITILPFAKKVIGEDFVIGLEQASLRLGQLRTQLIAGGFDIGQFSDRAIASVDQLSKIDVDIESLARLQERLQGFGRTDLSVLQEQFNQEKTLLENALRQGLITRQQFNQLSLQQQREFGQEQSLIARFSAQETAQILQESGGVFAQFTDGVRGRILDLQQTSIRGFNKIGEAAFDGIGRGVGSAFAAFGKALVEGQNGLEAFGKVLLSTIGQQAIAAGTEILLRGLAYLGDPLFAAFAPAMIARGAALAAFGGALTAVGGGGGGGAGGGGNTGQIQPTSGAPQGPDLDQLEERGPSVTVNVAGDILDSENSRQRFGELLREEIEKTGSSSILQVT